MKANVRNSLLGLGFLILAVSVVVAQPPAPVGPQGASGGRGGPFGGSGGRGPGGGMPMASRSPSIKRVLVFAGARGFYHDSIPDAAVAVYEFGKQTGLWDTMIRTDTDLIVHKKAGNMIGWQPQGLLDFDAIVFDSTTGSPLNVDQMNDLMTTVKEDGKGFVGIHAALDSSYNFPEYPEFIGGWFSGHPFNTGQHPIFPFPIINEDPTFPAVRHFPHEFWLQDELYVPKNWSRDKVNVLLRLDESKLDFTGKTAPSGNDVAVAWSKMYGKGRVFYSSIGHAKENWSDPEVRTMYLEAVKWVLGITEGSTESHPRPSR
jgi:type 1 glutamine amidotransferase